MTVYDLTIDEQKAIACTINYIWYGSVFLNYDGTQMKLCKMARCNINNLVKIILVASNGKSSSPFVKYADVIEQSGLLTILKGDKDKRTQYVQISEIGLQFAKHTLGYDKNIFELLNIKDND